jgi:hypothetical protein
MSADERILPVLGYSDETFFDPNNIPLNMQGWLNGYVDEMNYVFTLVGAEKHPDWDNILEGNITRGTSAVAPLIDPFKWDQECGYNFYAPPMSGPCGKAYTGCVATAMAMVMKFWNHPVHGFGSHSYTYNGSTYTANFGEEEYKWNEMPNQVPGSNVANAVAKLMNHCAISVDMQWGGYSTGSGAYTVDVAKALKDYFGYQKQCIHRNKYSNISAWEDLMREELDLGRPMEYHGNSTQSGGHAFVLDGYDDNNKFHFNWGWSGYSNGYFTISNLNPMGYNFNSNQGAVMCIEPDWTLFCNEPTNLKGTLDGRVATLTWNEPVLNGLTLKEYEIYKNGTLVGTVTEPSAEDHFVGYGENKYCIVASYEKGCITDNTTVCTTIISDYCYPPRDLVTFVYKTDVMIMWDRPEVLTGLSKYEVYRDGEFLVETNELEYTDEDVPSGKYEYCVLAVYGEGDKSDDICEEVEVNLTGITALNQNNVEIYPNPAKNNINIKTPNITEVSVINSVGKIVKIEKTSCNELSLDLEGFAKGMYILKINTQGNEPVYRKFVISD